ncbi:MAG: TolC family protein [Alphaproteobacteria bacterium]|nr:TolC family protein [Alphaproteobacteria bacterium]
MSFIALIAGAGLARAETVDDSMKWALRSSFAVQADNERQAGAEARMRGSVEAFLPTVAYVNERVLTSKITYAPDYTLPDQNGADTVARRQPNAQGFMATMPLFDGFQRLNNFQSARTGVQAGKYLQLDAQQQTYLAASTAYLAIVRDRRIVALRVTQVGDIAKILERTKVRFSMRDATQTDVDISNSRLLQAQADVEQANANLRASEIEYTRISGTRPGRLAPPRVPYDAVPSSVSELEQAVITSNPQLQASRLGVVAAGYDARAKVADVLPQVNLYAASLQQTHISQALDKATDNTVKIQMRVPIYEPGAYSRIAEGAAAARQKWWENADAQKQGVAKITTLYVQYQATRGLIKRADERVKAMESAVYGIGVERTAGFRTVIDTLNAQSELIMSEMDRVNLEFQRDSLVFTIAAGLSRLTPDGRTVASSQVYMGPHAVLAAKP